MMQHRAVSFLGTVAASGMEVVNPSVEVPPWCCELFAILVLLGIGIAYRSQGPKGLSLLFVYIGSLISLQLMVKQVQASFRFPFFITACHMTAQCSLAVTLRIYRAMQTKKEEEEKVVVPTGAYTPWWYATQIGPIVVGVYLSIVLNNMSLLYIGAGLNTLMGILTPMITTLIAACFGLRITILAWAGMAIAVVGDAVVTSEGVHSLLKQGADFHLVVLGVSFSFIAMFFRALKHVLLDRFMNSYGNGQEVRLTPFEIWELQAPALCALSLVAGAAFEGLAPWKAVTGVSTETLAFLVLSSIGAIVMALSALTVISMVGAPAAQIAGKMNTFITAAMAAAFMGEKLTTLEMMGTIVVIIGAATFERGQKEVHKEKGSKEAIRNAADKMASYDGAGEKA